MNFDSSGVGRKDAGIFGLPYTPDEAQVVLIPAPWAVTVSYGAGAEAGPRAILEASPQIDYAHESYGNDSWKLGVAMLPLEQFNDAYKEGVALRERARKRIEALERGEEGDPKDLGSINKGCWAFNEHIKAVALEWLGKKKLVGVVGGDHSTPLGLMQALAETTRFGILHIDAHCDLRDTYEGFAYSHASIMWNAYNIPSVERITQVGVRDYSIVERSLVENSDGKIRTFFDADTKRRQLGGEPWMHIVEEIVETLPRNVFVSFDIDGLDPALCPHTGTPVPGGLQFAEATTLIRAVAESGRRIIGFDVNEVAPGESSEWDANVGMRILWDIALWSARSNGLRPLA